jgi:hypothetical protein
MGVGGGYYRNYAAQQHFATLRSVVMVPKRITLTQTVIVPTPLVVGRVVIVRELSMCEGPDCNGIAVDPLILANDAEIGPTRFDEVRSNGLSYDGTPEYESTFKPLAPGQVVIRTVERLRRIGKPILGNEPTIERIVGTVDVGDGTSAFSVDNLAKLSEILGTLIALAALLRAWQLDRAKRATTAEPS